MGNGEVKETKKSRTGLIVVIVLLVLVIGGIGFFALLPGMKYRAAMSKAQKYLDDEKYEQAISEYKKAKSIKVSGNDAEEEMVSAYLAWAKSQIKDEEYEDAIDSCEQALEINEKSKKAKTLLSQAQYELAESYFQKGDKNKAEKFARKALKSDPDNTEAEALLAKIQSTPGVAVVDGRDSDGGFVQPGDTGEKPNGDGEMPADTKEKITLTMWCIATEYDSMRPAYEAALSDVMRDHPEIRFNWEAFDSQAYKTKIKAAMAANEVPDIFYTWPCSFLQDFVYAGRVYQLDDAYASYKNELPKTMMEAASFDGHYYGVPMTYNCALVFANLDYLLDSGYDSVPTTFEDLLNCCAALKERGITPFGLAGAETWCASEVFESMFIKTMGREELNNVFLGRDTWNNQQIKDVIDTFLAMRNAGYISNPGEYRYNDEAKTAFMEGKVAFYLNGSWNCADFAMDAMSSGRRFIVGEFPLINSDKSQTGELIGGPHEYLSVSASSPHAKEAADYTFELCRAICYYACLDGCGLPAWNLSFDWSGINQLTVDAARIGSKASGFVVWGDTGMNYYDASSYLDALASVCDGRLKDGEEFIQKLTKEIR